MLLSFLCMLPIVTRTVTSTRTSGAWWKEPSPCWSTLQLLGCAGGLAAWPCVVHANGEYWGSCRSGLTSVSAFAKGAKPLGIGFLVNKRRTCTWPSRRIRWGQNTQFMLLLREKLTVQSFTTLSPGQRHFQSLVDTVLIMSVALATAVWGFGPYPVLSRKLGPEASLTSSSPW